MFIVYSLHLGTAPLYTIFQPRDSSSQSYIPSHHIETGRQECSSNQYGSSNTIPDALRYEPGRKDEKARIKGIPLRTIHAIWTSVSLFRFLQSDETTDGRLDVVAKKHGGGREQAFIVFEEQTAATAALRGLSGQLFYQKALVSWPLHGER